ncbi:protein kinase domain-containing protein [Ditylenchus destructor]|uniref:Protein kinase domain-containing protein n=1 Tax=Ditylenchus destructor TaxID=166010 RepID=A0AAD4MUW6_9BILA|nr:protein kinase domain-containing protein [Ditylenchus destructor]
MDKQVNEAKRTKPTNNTDPKVAELAKKSELYALKKVTIKRNDAAKLELVRNIAIALREVYIWRKIGAHKRIVPLHEVYADGDDLLLVLSLAGGGELFDVMNFLSSQNPPKKLTMDQALFYLSEIVEALKHIHGLGIIYHDLKPENILLGLDGHGYLSDMGVADKANTKGISYVSGGTSEFMAPEIFNDAKHAHTKKADIFSLGALTIYMLTNRSIFRATKKDSEGNEVDKYEDKAKQADAIGHNIKTQVINKEVLKTMVKTHGLPDDEDLHEFLEKCLQHDVNERPTIEGVENLAWLSNYRARVTQGVKPPFRVSSLVKINSTVVTRIASKGKTGIKYTLNPA